MAEKPGLEALIQKVAKYQPDAPVEAIRRAYEFARSAHEGEIRASGEPYIQHPLEVAWILADFEMDATALQAAFLHDVVEDTGHTLDEIRAQFGEDVALLVDGVTKLSFRELESHMRASQGPEAPGTASEPDLSTTGADAGGGSSEAKFPETRTPAARKPDRITDARTGAEGTQAAGRTTEKSGGGAAEGVALPSSSNEKSASPGSMDSSGSVEAQREIARHESESRRQAENLRKIFLAMARDVRVMIIKLADRLHNMRTLAVFPLEKQRKIARETLDIYAPLAHRLGIWEMKWQLEDLSFKYLYPEEFNRVAETVAKTRARREGEVQQTIEQLEERLKANGIDATIQGRPKHLWSIFNKMQHQSLDITAIHDLIAVRVIVNTVAECYQALGVVHDLWKPIPGLFGDYIAKPKGNLYRSLHTKVLGPAEEPVEIQIRNWEMHRTAEFGVAAHWQYKEGGRPDKDFERRLAQLRQQLFDWQRDSRDASQFLSGVTSELFSHQVFVFTPRGDVIDLPAGSTPIDFAFRIHSDVGLHCVGAKVNGRIVPLSHVLENGDIVAVMTRSNANPSLDWLHFVKTSHARNRIKAYFRKAQSDELEARGREALRTELQRHGLDGAGLLRSPELERIAERFKLHSVEALLVDIGYGRLSAESVANRLRESLEPAETLAVSRAAHGPARLDVSVGGASGILIRRSVCCLPLPGDDVVGYVSRGRGLALHRRVCPNAIAYAQSEPHRLTDVAWNPRDDQFLDAPLVLVALSRVGLLNEITTVFSQTHTNILQAKATEREDKMGVIEIAAEVRGVDHLNELIARLQDLPDIISIQRGPIHRAAASNQRVAPRSRNPQRLALSGK